MTDSPPYPTLAEFASTWAERDETAVPYAHRSHGASPIASLDALGVRERMEDVLDTVIALQRASWLEDGVFVGPRAEASVYRDVLEAARRLQIAVPPAILSKCSGEGQGAFGTDSRAFLHLSSFFFKPAAPAQRRFIAGRLCGHVHARQVTWSTLYALLVDQGGLRKVARQGVGPALELVLAPLSVGIRLALSRWHRTAEITADRAGLLCVDDLDAAGTALLRIALGGRPDLTPKDYLEQLRAVRSQGSPGRWTEVLASRPWLHKRLRALELFARSDLFVELGGTPLDGPRLSLDELHRQTDTLLQVR